MSKRKIKTAILVSVLLLVGIAGYLWQAGFLASKVTAPAGPLEKITLSTLPIYTPSLLFIAQEKGYFKENGLDVTIKLFQTGQIGLEEMQAGHIDIAHIADFVLVDAIFKGATSLRGLGSIVAADINHLLARKDRGISQPRDLKGKKIGVPRGTIAEFFLGTFLTFNNLSFNNVKIIYLAPSEMSEALAREQVDAVMIWDPVTYDIKKRFGDRIISWPGQSNQKFYHVLVTTAEFAQNRSRTLERLFQALTRAENFIKNNPDESIEITAKLINLDQSLFNTDWHNSNYELSLNQSLLIAMEDEARWMIQNQLTDRTRLPDFLDYIDAAPLAKVDPKAVRIIIPKDERPPRASRDGAGAPMRIRTRVKIAGALIICVLLAYGALVLYLDRTMSQLVEEVKKSNEIVNKITILRNLTQDYLLYHTERAQRQWSAVYGEVLRLLDKPEYRLLNSEYGIGDAPQKLKIVGDTFSRLMSLQPTAGPDNPEEEARGELQNRLTTQLLLATQDLLTRFLNLNEVIQSRNGSASQRLSSILDILALSLLGILLLSNAVFLQRAVVKPVLKLHAGAEIIGAGNLNYQVGNDQ